ncbi:MAG TPA: hypothetical protein VIR38_14560 [Thalassobaculum sp.]
MVESASRAEAARLEAQGNPQFTDARLQAIVRDFEAEYAFYGRDLEKLEAGATRCPLAPKDAFELLRAVDYDEPQADNAKSGQTSFVDLDSIEIRVISGRCDAGGVEGPAEIVGTLRTVTRYASGEYQWVVVTDGVERVRGTWADNRRQGPFRTIAINRSATFKPGEAGALVAEVHDWDYLNEMSAAPTGRWTYSSHGANRSMEPFVEFVRNPESGSFETFVTEHRADGIDYRRTYRGSEMVNEGLLKDGRMHGWLVRHPFTYQGDVVPGGRDCFQNGEPIKVTSCPAD